LGGEGDERGKKVGQMNRIRRNLLKRKKEANLSDLNLGGFELGREKDLHREKSAQGTKKL